MTNDDAGLGEDARQWFQAKYVRDIMRQCGSRVDFVFLDGSAPTIMRDPDNIAALYVLMPMRI